MKKKPDSLSAGWTPFVLCESDPRDPDIRIYKNSRYQVHVRLLQAQAQSAPAMIHVSLRRRDRGNLIPFRDLMRLKRELLGPEIELVELFPAESRLVDTTNQFHYWGINSTEFRWPFGFDERLVGDGNIGNGKQTPYEPDDQPADWLSSEQLQERI